jgi:hypothetical protein
MSDQASTPSDSPAQAGTTFTIEQLGKEIVARIEAGDRCKAQADDRYRSAGLLLIEARKRVPVKGLAAFLKDHCAGLSLTRAKELIAIAEGRTTQEEVRAKATARQQRHRANEKATGRDSHGQSASGTGNGAGPEKPSKPTATKPSTGSGETKQVKKGSPEWLYGEAVYFDKHTMASMDEVTHARVMKMFADSHAQRQQQRQAAA